MRSKREKQENHFWSIIVIILLLFFRMYKMLRFLSNRGLVNSQRLIRIRTRWARRLCAKFHLYMSILGLNIFTNWKKIRFSSNFIVKKLAYSIHIIKIFMCNRNLAQALTPGSSSTNTYQALWIRPRWIWKEVKQFINAKQTTKTNSREDYIKLYRDRSEKLNLGDF